MSSRVHPPALEARTNRLRPHRQELTRGDDLATLLVLLLEKSLDQALHILWRKVDAFLAHWRRPARGGCRDTKRRECKRAKVSKAQGRTAGVTDHESEYTPFSTKATAAGGPGHVNVAAWARRRGVAPLCCPGWWGCWGSAGGRLRRSGARFRVGHGHGPPLGGGGGGEFPR